MKKLLFLLAFLATPCFADIHHPPLQVNDNGNIYYGWFYLLTISGGTTTNPNDGTLTVNCGAVATTYILLENSSILLFEDGTKALLE